LKRKRILLPTASEPAQMRVDACTHQRHPLKFVTSPRR
jgi:hypothetical protein